MAGLAALVDRVLDHLAHPGEHQLTQVDTLEDFAALTIDDFALLVHDVVVLDEVAAGVEVVPLDLGLCGLDLARYPARLARLRRRPPAPVSDARCELSTDGPRRR